MTTFQMDLADRWLVVPLGDADAVAHWPADLGSEPRYEDPDDVEHLLDAARRVAEIPADDTLAVRLLYLPDPPFHPVFTDLHELVAEGEADERLPALITVEDNERGPRTPEKVELGEGAAAYRSIGAVPGPWEEDTAIPQFLCCHALRRGGIDVLARTWLGPDPRILTEVITPLETMLASLQIDS